MKGTVIFDRDKLEWYLVDVGFNCELFKGAKYIIGRLTDVGRERFLHILDVELDSLEMTGENSYSWSSSELPDTPDIHQCIRETRDELNRVKAILFN